MYLDDFAEFCDATALNTGAPATFNIGDVIDTHVGSDNTLLNVGVTPIYLFISVAADITSSVGGGTLQFQLASDNADPMDTGAATKHLLTPVFTTATSVPAGQTTGSILFVGVIPSDFTYERYVGLQMTSGTNAIATGSINAFLTMNAYRWTAYADRASDPNPA